MTSYEWGEKPTFTDYETINESTVLEKGEWARICGHEFWVNPNKAVTDKEFADNYMQTLAAKGAIPVYIRVSHNYRQVPQTSIPNIVYRIEECVFHASPIIMKDIITLVAILVFGVSFLAMFRPEIIQKCLGITPEDAQKYAEAKVMADVGSMGLLLVIALIVFVIFGVGAWGKRRR